MPLNNKEGYVEPVFRTATETIMKVMERFSETEPRGVIIVHTDESGALIITANVNKCNGLGMLMSAQTMILNGEA